LQSGERPELGDFLETTSDADPSRIRLQVVERDRLCIRTVSGAILRLGRWGEIEQCIQGVLSCRQKLDMHRGIEVGLIATEG